MTLIAALPWISANRAPHRGRTIRSRLMQIVFTLVVPGAIGFAIIASSFYASERDRIAQSTITTAHALMSAVDRDLLTTTVAAQIMAASPLLQSDDFAAFHRDATKLIPVEFGDNFVLYDSSGNQLLNTLVPYGQIVPIRTTREDLLQVFKTGKPSISDVFIGRFLHVPVVAFNIPVFRGSEVKYVLSIGMFPQRLTELLLRQKLPPNWIASVIDASGNFVSRTRNMDRFVGQKAAPVLLEAMSRESSGVVENKSVEGIPLYSAFSRSDVSNWTVAIGIPAAELSSDLNRLLLLGGAGMIGVLLAGLALARYQSNQIADAVQSLIPPALALGRGEVPKTSRLDVREADEVAQALVRAYEILQSRTVERDHAEQKEEQGRALTDMMDEFVANVSHELRTPLTSIAGSLGLLVGGASEPLPAGAARLVSIAHVNAQRLVRLINDLLDIGKIESGNMTFDFAAVDLRAIAEQAIDANRGFAAVHGASIRIDALSSNCTVRADADRLIQVFTNLLSNAIKFSPKGGEVVVTLKSVANMGCILVRDHGPGVPAEFGARMFDKFTQAGVGDARQMSGTGLGLNIVAKIVAQHGGTIGFEDAPDGGTIFRVEIPLWTAQALTAPAA